MRLVLAVGVGVVAGGVLYGELTSDKLAGCVAGSMEGAAGTPK
ncbi:MAG: hypothetical protein R3A78_08685 [Polyangiales bacterium]